MSDLPDKQEWAMVPREPTEAMLEAGCFALDRAQDEMMTAMFSRDRRAVGRTKMLLRYRAMLAAAPVEPRGVEQDMTERLAKAAHAIKDDVCGLLCPSVWKTADGPPPHHPKCIELRAALFEAIDELSYSDLRSSGGIAGAP